MSSDKKSVSIRIWDGCVVRHVMTVTPTGSTTLGAVGGAGNSTQVDIELDPWAGLLVDNRVQYPSPVPIALPEFDDEDEEPELGQEYDRRPK